MGDYFSKQSGSYARFRPDYPPELFSFLFSLVPEKKNCWDVATGNGQAALPLAAEFEKVIATDLSGDQLSRAAQHPKIKYRQCPSENCGIGENSLNLITVAQALHWFPSDAFYEEIRRVAKSGAIFAAWSYGLHRSADEKLNSVVQVFYRETVGEYWPAGRHYVDEEYKTIPFPFTKLPVPDFFIEKEWDRDDYLGYFGSWSAVQRYRDARGADPVQSLAEKISEIWPEAEEKKTVRFPLYVLVGRIE